MFEELVDAAPEVLDGVLTTTVYTALGAVAALLVSFAFGLMALSRRMLVRGVSRAVVEFFRGTSLVVQLLWFAYVLPQLGLGFKLEPIGAAALALALNFGAYGSEVVRGAVNAVPPAQWEATVALGLSPAQRMRRVILPQALPEMIPPFSNLLVQMLKGSSLLYLINITDLSFELQQLRRPMQSVDAELGSIVAFGFGLVVYFVLAQVFIALMRLAESRASARVGRGPRFERLSARAQAGVGAP